MVRYLAGYDRCTSRSHENAFADLLTRGGDFNRPVHVINIEIKDNHEEAHLAGKAMVDLASAVRLMLSAIGLYSHTLILCRSRHRMT